MIVAFYSVYGHPRFFARSVASIVDHVDRIIVVFGRYVGFPELRDDGYDEYRRVAHEHDAEFLVVGPLSQVAKRNLAFELTRDGDWIFVIDDDEIAVGDVAVGMARVRTFMGEFALVPMDDENLPAPRVRFMRSRPNRRYGPTHWLVRDGEVVVSDYLTAKDSILIEDFRLVNAEDKNKDKNYNKGMEQYVRFLHLNDYIE